MPLGPSAIKFLWNYHIANQLNHTLDFFVDVHVHDVLIAMSNSIVFIKTTEYGIFLLPFL